LITDNRIDRLIGPTGIYAGYFLMLAGLAAAYFFSIAYLLLALAGTFIAFTYDGTQIDFGLRKIRGYSCLFGLIKVGKWYDIDSFSKFHIIRSKRTHTTYSRANVPLTQKESDIRLLLLNENGSVKITVNKFRSFEEARKEMTDLIKNLQITKLKEWI
jgi:hypothetical protein